MTQMFKFIQRWDDWRHHINSETQGEICGCMIRCCVLFYFCLPSCPVPLCKMFFFGLQSPLGGYHHLLPVLWSKKAPQRAGRPSFVGMLFVDFEAWLSWETTESRMSNGWSFKVLVLSGNVAEVTGNQFLFTSGKWCGKAGPAKCQHRWSWLW